MQGAESSEQCNKNELIPALRQNTNMSGSRSHFRRVLDVEQTVRINQPRPSARELEEGAGRMSASRQKQPLSEGLIMPHSAIGRPRSELPSHIGGNKAHAVIAGLVE
jgi:hypothetical protein